MRATSRYENHISRALVDLENRKTKLASLHIQLADMVPELADVFI